VVLWAVCYRPPRQHPWLGAAELAHIEKDPPDPPATVPWLVLLQHRQTWAFVVGMAASAPVWWFYIYWIPDFLNKQYQLKLTQSSLPLITIFLVADVGGIAGGWLSSHLIKRGWSINAARKTTLLACAVCVLPVFLTPLVGHLWGSVALVALAASAHCGFAANLFTLVSDTVPRKAVSSVVGIGGMAGAIAGMFSAQLIGRVLHFTHNNYFVPFALASVAYLLALGIMHLLVPKLEPMKLEKIRNPNLEIRNKCE
jgi:ACS family hexuronate transporter-like MFS transporter